MSRIFEKSSGGIVYRVNVFGNFEILLLERKNQKGKNIYVIPKGHIENEEKAKETALREISEETGLAIEYLEVIKFITKINFTFLATYLPGNPTINKDVYLFLVKYIGKDEPKIVEEDPEEKGEKFTGFKWFKIEELRGIDLKPDVYSYIKKNIQFM
ncbi:MAG: NUDIX domain-containing protein [Candidatus Gracilibacteria bacterium]|nr:NUDIX domain-containing protein [Candidatus Gracilibacteria bacterium]MDD2908701.1 NUDIX domain-containing protein [Candidatus Gracilibacteria bacterium]